MSETETGNEQTSSWRDKTLKAAGYGYLVGDLSGVAASMARGGFEAKWSTAAGFLTWAAGGVAAAFYGNPDTEKQLDILAHKLEKYLMAHGATVSDAVRHNSPLLNGKDGFGAKLERFMHEHPTEILNAAYAAGAGMMIHEGIKEIRRTGNGAKDLFPKAMNKAALANVSSVFWLGGLVLAGALGGLLIKEDQDARAKVDRGSITSRIAGFFHEKPLRWSSTCYWAGNAFALKKAFDEKRSYKGDAAFKPHHFSFLTVAAYIVSNGLLSLSSRDQIEEKKFKPEHLAQLEQVAAEIIAAQPPQLQSQLLTQAALFIAQEKKIVLTPEQITRDLIARVSETSKRHLTHATENKWAEKVASQPVSGVSSTIG